MPFRNWTYPYGPIASIVLNSVLVLVQGWKSFSPTFAAIDFVSYYVELPVMLIMFVAWKISKRTKWVTLERMDLRTDRYDVELTLEERAAMLEKKSHDWKYLSWRQRAGKVGTSLFL